LPDRPVLDVVAEAGQVLDALLGLAVSRTGTGDRLGQSAWNAQPDCGHVEVIEAVAQDCSGECGAELGEPRALPEVDEVRIDLCPGLTAGAITG
jgi:hypothetical protein